MSEGHLNRVKQWYVENPGINQKATDHIHAVIDANRNYIDPDTEANISSGELDQAEAKLRDAKAAKEAGTMTVEEYKAVSAEVVRLRQVYRLQEHAADRRHKPMMTPGGQFLSGIIGGDATITGV